MLTLLVVIVGLAMITACAYWILSGTALGGNLRSQAPNLRTCPQCGEVLDPHLDHCPKCQLRTSV